MERAKAIAVALTIAMLASGLAVVPRTASGAFPHNYWFIDDAFMDFRIRDSADGTNPNGAAVRYWVREMPSEVNTNVWPPGGMPYPGMSDIVGVDGMHGTPYFAGVQTAAMQTDPLIGNEIIFIMELDKNVAAAPRTYINDGIQIGTVPHGYIWAGSDTHSWESDQIVLPSGSPPTTFFEALEMSVPYTYDGFTWEWDGLEHTQPSDVAGDVLGQIEYWTLFESVNYDDMDGPWQEIGTAAFGNNIIYSGVMGYWYTAVPTWKGGVRSLVYTKPGSGYVPPPPPPWASNLAASPNPHNGDTISEYVTLSATITDCCGIDTLSAEYRVDGGPWTVFWQTGTSPLNVFADFYFPAPYTEGAHIFEVRGFDGMEWGSIESSTFTITDTTPPVAAWNTVPGATAYDALDMVFTAYYEDFTALQTAIGSSYFWYSVNGGPQQHLAWNAIFEGYGSYMYSLSVTIPGGTFVPGDDVTYGGQVTDTAITPNTAILGTGGPITVVATPQLFDIPVIMGWNLISFPVDASGSPDIVLNDYGWDTQWDVVKWYDGQTKLWKSYRIGSSANTLNYIDCTMGLWVHITVLGDGMLGVIGEMPETTQIMLYAGWNLVGYPANLPRTVGEALMGTGWDRAEVFDPAPPYIKPVGPDYVLYPGQGFWVRVPSDTVWSVSNAPTIPDPYMIFGRVLLYDGTSSGGYNPLASGDGAPVTVTWWNPAVGWDSVATTTSSGLYSAEIANYLDGGLVYVNATFGAPYSNKGYNYTYIDVMMGGSQQDVVCGVPYEIRFGPIFPMGPIVAGEPFSFGYQILDRDGKLARGYFSFSDGSIEWSSTDPLFIPPVPYYFEGTADPNPGQRFETITIYSHPMFPEEYQWIYVQEFIMNEYLTPWGEFYIDSNSSTPGWLNDSDAWGTQVV